MFIFCTAIRSAIFSALYLGIARKTDRCASFLSWRSYLTRPGSIQRIWGYLREVLVQLLQPMLGEGAEVAAYGSNAVVGLELRHGIFGQRAEVVRPKQPFHTSLPFPFFYFYFYFYFHFLRYTQV